MRVMTADELPNKKDVARALLLKGSVFVHLDPRVEAVFVPEWLKRQPQLVLQVGLDMAVPIPDLRVDDTGVYGTLTFNRAPFTCAVPWDAVFAVVGDDGRGMVWPDSMPKEIAAEVEREAHRARLVMPGARAEQQAGEGGEKRRRRPARRSAEEAQPAQAAPPPAAPRAPRAKPKPQTLELIAGKGAGDRAASATKSPRRERRPLPSYLRVVK
jgi:hypothetical protein